MYYSLIGDIKNSKKMEDRIKIQDKLEKVLSGINNSFGDQIASKLTVTVGDEFQGLFFTADKVFEAVNRIELEMHPVKFRFSIGYGDVITKINKEQAIGSDGPVWWHAREGMEKLRVMHEKGIKEISNIIISGLNDKAVMEIVNSCLVLLAKIKESWTPAQREIIKYIIENYGLTSEIKQSLLAKKISLPADVVNKRLKNSNYFDYALAFEKIVNVLKNVKTV
jgi:hypothetical protein